MATLPSLSFSDGTVRSPDLPAGKPTRRSPGTVQSDRNSLRSSRLFPYCNFEAVSVTRAFPARESPFLQGHHPLITSDSFSPYRRLAERHRTRNRIWKTPFLLFQGGTAMDAELRGAKISSNSATTPTTPQHVSPFPAARSPIREPQGQGL
jgi:hypothetical protein